MCIFKCIFFPCVDIRNGYGTEEAQRPGHIGQSPVKAFTIPNSPTGELIAKECCVP